ncbi:hypothetical protein OAJ57_04070 [Alphaproteobacteria bacterium]|nr:hypothetical protein [Alphaproteobacteria bacterium]
MDRSYKILPVVVIMALVISGCNRVFVHDTPGPRANYNDGDFEFATHKGAIVTAVAGNPFDLPKQQFDTAVRVEMTRSVTIGTANFVAMAGDETVAPFKVVVAFNTAPSISNYDLCKHGAKTSIAPQSSRINVKMAFCEGDNLKSGTAAWVYGASNASDNRFKDLVRQAAITMIPIQDGEENGESIFRP